MIRSIIDLYRITNLNIFEFFLDPNECLQRAHSHTCSETCKRSWTLPSQFNPSSFNWDKCIGWTSKFVAISITIFVSYPCSFVCNSKSTLCKSLISPTLVCLSSESRRNNSLCQVKIILFLILTRLKLSSNSNFRNRPWNARHTIFAGTVCGERSVSSGLKTCVVLLLKAIRRWWRPKWNTFISGAHTDTHTHRRSYYKHLVGILQCIFRSSKLPMAFSNDCRDRFECSAGDDYKYN